MSDRTVSRIDGVARPGSADRARDRRRGERRLRFQSQPPGAAQRSGFSSRLNLLCSLAGERDLGAGRIEDIATLTPEWSEEDVRGWLTRDEVPPLSRLQSLLRFLTAEMPGAGTALHWEAFLLYGSDMVGYPPRHLHARDDRELLLLAAQLLSRITREQRIPAESYDAQAALDATLQALRDLNVDPAAGEVQDAHRRIVALRVFAR